MSKNIAVRLTKLFIYSHIHNYNKTVYTNAVVKRMVQLSSNKILISANQKLAVDSVKAENQKKTECKTVLSTLQKLFKISQAEAKGILKGQKQIKKCSFSKIEENFNICINNGIKTETMQRYLTILILDSLEKKIKYFNKISVDINDMAPILLADESVIKRIVLDFMHEEKDVPYGNRIVYISKLLNLPVQDVCERILDHLFILRMPFDRLESNLKILLEYGIEPNNIINDCWSLRYNAKVAEERLKRAMEANVSKVKTWMIRCPNDVFERCINRQVENRKILGTNSTVEEYLSERLECSVENAKYLTEKNPALLKMNILKMKEILDYLYDQGYTSTHVCRVPRILIHSLETTKQRIKKLKELGHIPPSLAILCKSKRDFDKALKKYKKLKKIRQEKQNKSSDS